MANRLVRYERALFARSFGAAFGTVGDKLLLAAGGSLAALGLMAAARDWSSGSLPDAAVYAPVVAVPLSAAWQRTVADRLRWLAEHSAVAADALTAASRCQYLIAAHGILLLPLLIAAGLVAAAAGSLLPVVVLVLAYASGILLAWTRIRTAGIRASAAAARPLNVDVHGFRAVFHSVLRCQLLGSGKPERRAVLVVAAVLLTTLAGATLAPRLPAEAQAAATAAPSFALLLLALRVEADLLGFLPSAGYGPGQVALAVSFLPGAGLLAAAAVIAVTAPPNGDAILALLALAHLAVIAGCVARAWLLPGRTSRAVSMQLQFEIVALALLASVLPPLAPAALALRLAMLRHRHAALRWKQL